MIKQPKIDIPKTRFEKLFDVIAIILFVLAVAHLFVNYGSLPDRVPGHYNAIGEVDRWGGKTELFLLPVIGAVLWIAMTLLEKVPHTYNYLNLNEKNITAQYKNGRLMMNVLKNECVLLFSFLTYQGIHVATGEAAGLGTLVMPVLLFCILGSTAFFLIRMLRL